MPTTKAVKSKKILFVSLLIALLIGLDLVVGTLVIPWSGVLVSGVRNLHPYYNHGFDPNATAIMPYGPLAPVYYTNSLGLKDAFVRQVSDSSNKHRILFLGDSFTEGIGYSWDSGFCGLLSKKVDTSQVEILNAAVAGYSPKLYYLKADYLLNHQHLAVNEIYCFIDFSDVSDELVYQDFVPKVPDVKEDVFSSLRKFYRHHSLAYLVYSQLAINNFLKTNKLNNPYLYWTKSSDRFCKETDYKFEEFKGQWISDDLINAPVTIKAIGFAKANLINLLNVCNQHHIKLHLVIYPESHQVFGNYARFDYQLQRNARYISIWKDFATEQGIDFISLFPLFPANNQDEAIINSMQYYIKGDPHWNFEGHKKVADSLFALMNDSETKINLQQALIAPGN